MAATSIKRALIAVYDKTGIADFARLLVDEFGVEIISTGGTAKHLKDAGIPVTMVEEVTGFPELLDGRVKTLHPKIHAGILADRDNPEHMRQLAEHGIKPIDMVVVNLYPFEETIAREDCTFDEAIEMIDIGGPCMLRAAAKNHRHVYVVFDPVDYEDTLDKLRESEGCHDSEPASWCSHQTFRQTCLYDAQVASWLMSNSEWGHGEFRLLEFFTEETTRYGENPHQTGELVCIPSDSRSRMLSANLSHSEMSFNNYVDADAALSLCSELSRAQPALWHRLIAGAKEVEPNRAVNMQPVRDDQLTRRNLPHIQREGVTYFVTFRFRRGELSPEERDIVMECCVHPDGKKLCLHAAVVMPDHVHLIFTPLEAPGGGTYSLGDILHSIKGYSARRISDLQDVPGQVWQDESFDRVVRNDKEFDEKLKYVCENPVTAGLPDAESYPWSICEGEPSWSSFDKAAVVDSGHFLKCYFEAALNARGWYRLLAGSTARDAGATGPASHRLLAGATARAGTHGDSGPPQSICVFIKHTNACGVGVADDPVEAYRRAYLGDPNAAMGGILAVDFHIDVPFAETVMATLQQFKDEAAENGCAHPPKAFFAEVIVAPSYDDEAVQYIRGAKQWGERVRLLDVGDISQAASREDVDIKRVAGGMLLQTPDLLGLNESDWKIVSKRTPSDAEMADLRLAWLICKHTKSNAITICKDNMLIGNGAGQMSRVMSCRIATWLAKENGHGDKLAGAVAASDAFFPFRDGLDILIDAGVTAIIQPGGSKRDSEVIAAADERGIAMIMTGTRHFKH